MNHTRKTLLALVCVAALLLGCMPVFAAQTDFRYETGADGVTLTAYLGNSASPAIPAELDGKPVTAIGDGCFQGLLCLKTVRIPEGIARIGDYAFECCGNLRKVYLPDSLREIGDGAFSGCSALTLVDMQDGVRRIGRGAFLCCDALVTIELSPALESLGDFAFAWCDSLARVRFGGSGLTAIPDRAFYRCAALSRISLPERVASIGKRAFSGCESLKSFYHGTPLTHLGEYAFEGCEAIENLTVSAPELPRGVFSGCAKLDWFSVADGVKSIGSEAFLNSGVTNISLPASLTALAPDAFRGATPDSVYLDAENEAFSEAEGSLCTIDGKTLLLACPGRDDEGAPAGTYAVPDGVEVIESFAFDGRILSEVTLPASLKEIHAYAFAAAQIERMDIPEAVAVDPKAFDDPGAPTEADASALSAQDAVKTEVKTTSAAGDKSLYREEDFKDYLAIDEAEFDAWSEDYLKYCDEHGSPVTQETIPYIMRYKGEVIPHFMAMTAVQNHDPDMWAQAANFFGDDFEQMYLMMNHGLFTELGRGKMPDDLVLYSGVYDSQLMAAAGTDHVPTQAELIAAIGSTFSDPCMISTTPNAPVACGFGDTLFIIYASREAMEAQGAVNIDAVAHSSEQEILMSAHANYRVLDVGTMTVTHQDPWAEEPETLARNYVRVELLAPETPNPFVDVADDAYYHDAVLWAVRCGVTNGVDDTHFAPDGEATRAQIVTFLYRAAGSPAASAKIDFTDVPHDAWYAGAVRWAVEQGITNGTSEKTFSPDKPCTRAEIVTFLHRAAGSPAAAGQTNPFTDVPAGSWFEAPVLWAVQQKITNGVSEKRFAPDKTCTRGEAVTFLYRANG
ncbi:MAG: leucine-rich repeat protein [Oscillospiraceae bacterium]|nr:leucine-rich repeat protein [Oscillospiraceae bacterium]